MASSIGREPLNIGIIGTGGIATGAHAPAINKSANVRLWSILSRDRQRGEMFADKFSAAANRPVRESMEQFLDDPELEAVLVASPDRLHFSQAMACLEAGKHVLVEKPLCVSVEEVDQLKSIVKQTGLTLALCLHMRWHQGLRMLREKIYEGLLGDVWHMRLHWTIKAPDGTNWRASRELGRWWSVSAFGPHCIDVARWIMGTKHGDIQEFKTITTSPVWNSEHDESAVLGLRFESGATAEIFTSLIVETTSHVDIFGSEGEAICRGVLGRNGDGSILVNNKEFKFPVMNPFVSLVENFADAINTGNKPEVDIDVATQNVRDLLRAAPLPQIYG